MHLDEELFGVIACSCYSWLLHVFWSKNFKIVTCNGRVSVLAISMKVMMVMMVMMEMMVMMVTMAILMHGVCIDGDGFGCGDGALMVLLLLC